MFSNPVTGTVIQFRCIMKSNVRHLGEVFSFAFEVLLYFVYSSISRWYVLEQAQCNCCISIFSLVNCIFCVQKPRYLKTSILLASPIFITDNLLLFGYINKCDQYVTVLSVASYHSARFVCRLILYCCFVIF